MSRSVRVAILQKIATVPLDNIVYDRIPGLEQGNAPEYVPRNKRDDVEVDGKPGAIKMPDEAQVADLIEKQHRNPFDRFTMTMPEEHPLAKAALLPAESHFEDPSYYRDKLPKWARLRYLVHETDERKEEKRNRGEMFFTHMSPQILLNEWELLKRMGSDKESEPAANFMRYLRYRTGEFALLRRAVAERYGKRGLDLLDAGKLPNTAKRQMSNAIKEQYHNTNGDTKKPTSKGV